MTDINERITHSINTFENIKYDLSKASLEDVTELLDHYVNSVNDDSVSVHFQINPLYAACLNERFRELTGKSYPNFESRQLEELDQYISNDNGLIVDGSPSIYERLKNNITGQGIGISIDSKNFMDVFNDIKFDMSKASFEEVDEILKHYGQDSFLLNGIQCHFSLTPLQGASLNARYKELTGQDHPTFAKVQEEVLREKSEQPSITVNGNKSVYEQMLDGEVEVGSHDHVLNRFSDIMYGLDEANLDDVNSLLGYYNSPNPVIIDGVAVHAFNDPTSAYKLNNRYRELTGADHPVFLEQTPKVIEGIMEYKDAYLESGTFGQDYFDKLEQMQEEINAVSVSTPDVIDEASTGKSM